MAAESQLSVTEGHPLTVSVIVPVCNAADHLERCLACLSLLRDQFLEVIVIDDASDDNSPDVAARFRATVIRLQRRSGPACARNIGAAASSGQILFFIDADVSVHESSLRRAARMFQEDPTLDALIGSYDDAAGSPDFWSQYRNLLHHYVHQKARESASTFWGACGAIRREVFFASGGFDVGYQSPSIEDIEFGYRLIAARRKIRLVKDLQVKHWKHWTITSVLRTDIYYRAIPWARLLFKLRLLPNDLGLRWSQRLSVVAVFLALLALLFGPLVSPSVAVFAAAGLACVVMALNADFYLFLARKRGLRFAFAVIPAHLLYFLSCGIALLVCFLPWRRGTSSEQARRCSDFAASKTA